MARERDLQKHVRKLARLAEEGAIGGFEDGVRCNSTPEFLTMCRSAKLLVRGDRRFREAAASILADAAKTCFDLEGGAEFARYCALSLAVSDARETVMRAFHRELDRLPRLSRRQLVQVAMKLFRKALPGDPEMLETDPTPGRVAENARRLHAMAGYSNDLMFAVARTLNAAWERAGDRDLMRADAVARAKAPFTEATRLASQLVALDNAYDSASFGHFTVTEAPADGGTFRLDIADMRLTLIRILSIRRRMTAIIAGRRNARFLRDMLGTSASAIINNALVRGFRRADHGAPTPDDYRLLETVSKWLLLQVGANDDLAVAAARGDRFVQLLYHTAFALRIYAAANKVVAMRLGPSARTRFDGRIHLAELTEDLADAGDRDEITRVWDLLTIDLPSHSQWALLDRPFVRTGNGIAHSLLFGDGDNWSAPVRAILLQGGGTGKNYGQVWEDFLANGFEGTGWQILGRNIKLKVNGKAITEIDLLLARGDLLLVIEIKALTGSGMNAYDHWKNREVIERGCRQARLAARHLDANRDLIASIANRRMAEEIRRIQPLVLTNEAMFDGWEHDGVPVAGETIRKAITQGTKVEYWDGHKEEVFQTDWYLRPEDLDTKTILAALRDPIELKIGPEQGDVVHHEVTAGGLRLFVPDPTVGPTDAVSEGRKAQF